MDLMNREEVLDNAFNSMSGRHARRVRKTRCLIIVNIVGYKMVD